MKVFQCILLSIGVGPLQNLVLGFGVCFYYEGCFLVGLNSVLNGEEECNILHHYLTFFFFFFF
jgi:hypothetical protein